MAWELVGYAGGFLIALALLPQLIKTFKTKSAKDLSLIWTIVLLTGLVLYIIYAAMNYVLPLLVFGTVEAIMVMILISLKMKYDRGKH